MFLLRQASGVVTVQGGYLAVVQPVDDGEFGRHLRFDKSFERRRSSLNSPCILSPTQTSLCH
jgi:hypothetical protein